MKTVIRDWVARHQLVSFFVLTYLIMFGVNLIYLYWVQVPYLIAWALFIFSPTYSALIVSGVIGGLPGIKRVLVGFTRWNVGLRWYLAALSLILCPLFITLMYISLGNSSPGPRPGLTIPSLIGQAIFTLFSGPLSEEAGWRGFALPRLQEKYSALVSSLILGVIWTCWHIPLYFVPGSAQLGIPFPAYLALVVTMGTFITWLYNNTKGSLIITVLAHFSINFNGGFLIGTLGLLPPMVFYMTVAPGLAIATVLVVIIFGPRYLSKRPVEELPFRPRETSQKSVVPRAALG